MGWLINPKTGRLEWDGSDIGPKVPTNSASPRPGDTRKVIGSTDPSGDINAALSVPLNPDANKNNPFGMNPLTPSLSPEIVNKESLSNALFKGNVQNQFTGLNTRGTPDIITDPTTRNVGLALPTVALPAATVPDAIAQRQLAGHLSAQALGVGGPTAAASLLNQQLARTQAAQRALASSARGAGVGTAVRGAQESAEDIMLQGVQQAATLRAQEQQAAQDALANVLGTSREQGRQEVEAAAQMIEAVRRGDLEQGNLQLYARQLDDQQAINLLELVLKDKELDMRAKEAFLNAFVADRGNNLAFLNEAERIRQEAEAADQSFGLGLAGTGINALSTGASILFPPAAPVAQATLGPSGIFRGDDAFKTYKK